MKINQNIVDYITEEIEKIDESAIKSYIIIKRENYDKLINNLKNAKSNKQNDCG